MRSSQTITLFSERPSWAGSRLRLLYRFWCRSGYRSGSVWPPAPAAIEESHTRRAIDRTQPGAAFARAGEAASSQRLRLSQPLSQREEDSEGVSSANRKQCCGRPRKHRLHTRHYCSETQEPSETPQDIPLPTVVLWSPEQLPVKSIIPPHR